MGPDQLSGVMDYIAREAAQSSNTKLDEVALRKRTSKFRDSVQQQSSAYYTSAHLLDDGVIDPRDTRDVLGMCLEVVNVNVQGEKGFRGVSRI